MAKRTYERAHSESGQQSFNVGKSTYRSDEKSFIAIVDTGKINLNFNFSPLKKTGQKSEKTENKSKEGNEEKTEEESKKRLLGLQN